MSDIKKKTLVFSILDFLKTSVEDGTIKGDDKEGVDVASQFRSPPELRQSSSSFGSHSRSHVGSVC